MIGCVLLGFLLPQRANAQREKVANLSQFDNRTWHFGFALSFNRADFHLDRKADIFFPDSLLSVQTVPQSGFNITIVSQLHLTKNLGLRFLPGLSFQDRLVNYTYVNSQNRSGTEVVPKRVESTVLHFPLNLKFRSNRLNNFAAYFVTGIRYSVDMASQAQSTQLIGNNAFLKMKNDDYTGEVGGGFDFFLPYFKLGIEFKTSMGWNNVLIQDHTKFSTPLDRLRSKLYIISFTFEG